MMTPYLVRYRNAEFVQFMSDVHNILNNHNKNQNLNGVPFEDFKVIVERLEIVFKTTLSSVVTKELETLDNARDESFRGIKFHIHSYTFHYNSKFNEAAQLLMNNINSYGKSITRLNYKEETSTLKNLINDWEVKTSLKKAINLLQLGDWIQELKKQNEAFAKVSLDRIDDKKANATESMSALREEAGNMFHKVIEVLKAHMVLGSKGSYTDVYAKIELLVKEYNLILIIRKSKSKEDLPEDIDTSTDDDINDSNVLPEEE